MNVKTDIIIFFERIRFISTDRYQSPKHITEASQQLRKESKAQVSNKSFAVAVAISEVSFGSWLKTGLPVARLFLP